MVRIRDEQNLEAQLRRLQALTRDELAAEWVKAHGVPAPRKSSRELLLKAVAHYLQVQVHGDLRPATRKALLRMARQMRSGSPVDLPAPPPQIKPGSRLIRAWRGETHEVIVAADGRFEWRGKRHRSLSSIATTITGTRRNGPAFFGLRQESHP
jgi:hypothetical protein